MTRDPVTWRFVPITLREANAFVLAHHRHHGPARGCVFVLAVAGGNGVHDDPVHGVAIVGRPVSRVLQDGYTAELTRCCTDGTKHAASKLIARAWRVAQQIGYRRMVSYVLADEAGGGSWSRTGRPRVDEHPTQTKIRWEAA